MTKKIRLKKLLSVIGRYKVLRGKTDVEVSGIEESSLDVKKGSVFIAVKGFSADGHDYAADAVKRGAAAVVVQKKMSVPGNAAVILVHDSKEALLKLTDLIYRDVKKKIKVIGITGTKGKTTVSYLIAAILKQKFKMDMAIVGTIAYRIGKKEHHSNNTTPSNLTLHKLMAEAVNSGIKYFILEISSHALAQGRAENITLDTAVVTNVTRDHFDFHKTFSNYLRAKLKIVDLVGQKGTVVVNADDPSSKKFVKKAQKRRLKTVKYSLNRHTEINVDSYKMDISHMKFLLNIKGKPLNMQSSLIGSHNIYNIMAAAGATFRTAGLANIKKAIGNFKKVEGRLEKIYNNKFIVIVDYAHTTDSLEKTLQVLNKLKQRQIITVFGAGGDRDKGKRPMMGKVVEKLSDKYIITSDNPRFEDPEAIIRDVLKGIKNKDGAIVEVDRARAIARAIKMASAGDIIFLAGKGHETYQAIKGKNVPFSDKEIALKEIKKKK